VNRRHFLLAPALLKLARAQTVELPDMLLNYFTQRFRNEVRPTSQPREKLRQISGPYPSRTPLKPQVLRTTNRTGYRIENILFESRPDFFVNGNLYLPAMPGPVPAILMPRGHFDPERMSPDYQQIAFDLVRSGFAVFSYDPIGQGERRQQWTEPGAAFDPLFSTSMEHALIGNKLALLGESSAGWQAWDGMRAIDYLLTRPEVDAKKIGLADHSDNGAESSILCAVEERIACAALHAPRFSHRWPPDPTTWIVIDDTQEYLPGAAANGLDTPEIFAAIAPRPLLVLVENLDGGFAATAELLGKRHPRFELASANAAEDWPKKLRLQTVAWFARWFGKTVPALAETDVIPELRSVLRTPNPGKSIYTLIRERAASVPPATVSVAELKQLIRPFSTPHQTPRILSSENVGSIRQDRLQLPSEPGIWLPAVLNHPAKPNGRIVVYAAGDVTALDPTGGDDDGEPPPPDRTAPRLAAKGFTVLSVDVRGIGAAAPRIPRRGFRVPYHHLMNRDMAFDMMAWSLNDSLFAMRVRDVLRALDFAAGTGDEVWLAGRDMGAQWALFAAALEPRVKGVVTQNGLASWRMLLEHDRYQQASSQFHWGILTKCDLPQVAATIAPRPVVILSPADHNRRTMQLTQAEGIYRQNAKQGSLKISVSGDIVDGDF